MRDIRQARVGVGSAYSGTVAAVEDRRERHGRYRRAGRVAMEHLEAVLRIQAIAAERRVLPRQVRLSYRSIDRGPFRGYVGICWLEDWPDQGPRNGPREHRKREKGSNECRMPRESHPNPPARLINNSIRAEHWRYDI
jgi:hypothetical protein